MKNKIGNPIIPACHPDKEHAAHGLCTLCYGRKHRQENKEAYRTSARKYVYSQYGITAKEYNWILEMQQGKCAICRDILTFGKKCISTKANLDHDHASNQIRGILCRQCNIAISLLKDRSDCCLAAANYLAGSDVVSWI